MLSTFIEKYDLAQILHIETQDRQYQALEKAWQNSELDPKLFCYLVLQCALVGYQVAGSGPQWREEFGEKITKDQKQLKKL